MRLCQEQRGQPGVALILILCLCALHLGQGLQQLIMQTSSKKASLNNARVEERGLPPYLKTQDLKASFFSCPIRFLMSGKNHQRQIGWQSLRDRKPIVEGPMPILSPFQVLFSFLKKKIPQLSLSVCVHFWLIALAFFLNLLAIFNACKSPRVKISFYIINPQVCLSVRMCVRPSSYIRNGQAQDDETLYA